LDKVEKVVNKRAYSIAVDPGDQSIVLAGGDRKLRELDKDQANLREYDAKLASSRPSLQLNPNGGQVLIFSGSNVVYHVRLPDRKAPMKK
jgi:hypothetical protein